MTNDSLSAAKAAKNDEFYTQYHDIENEINAYLAYNPTVFQNKTILLPCDDPEWSNFTLYFAQHFDKLGIKKLISTSYAAKSKKYKYDYKPTLFEQDAPHFDSKKTSVQGKIFILDRDTDKNGRIDVHDLQWHYLEGDGDFRSSEVTDLRDEADIIVTNPPFSLFREFISWIIKGNKKCLLIGNTNAITYKEIFPLIKDNKLWLGATGFSTDMVFGVPKGTLVPEAYKRKAEKMGYRDGDYTRLGNSCWFTNLEHGKRHQPLSLMTMDENLTYNKKIREKGYLKYDNYNAIEVPRIDAIPSDYKGVMGVPITFLDKYCPEQFVILGANL